MVDDDYNCPSELSRWGEPCGVSEASKQTFRMGDGNPHHKICRVYFYAFSIGLGSKEVPDDLPSRN
jgi:hypothetical protein